MTEKININIMIPDDLKGTGNDLAELIKRGGFTDIKEAFTKFNTASLYISGQVLVSLIETIERESGKTIEDDRLEYIVEDHCKNLKSYVLREIRESK